MSLVFLCACDEEIELENDCYTGSEAEVLNPIIHLDFPDCQLIEERFVASYGTTQNTYYYYDEGLMVRKDSYGDDKYNSTKLFGYNANRELEYMFTADSSGLVRDTLVSYDFCNGLLVRVIKYDLTNDQIEYQTTINYNDDRILEMEVIGIGENSKIRFITDNYGNPLEAKVIEIDGAIPEKSYRYTYQYDDKLNPFYKFPDFLSNDYFAQNNLIESTLFIDGVEQQNQDEIHLQYWENNLLKRTSDQFSQGLYTSDYVYDCD
ncbi:MAG: hypothetical protein CMP48_16685 [Rickettsiales bacterium]|nr:hypothetical protein [Rickettsiales bacterium]